MEVGSGDLQVCNCKEGRTVCEELSVGLDFVEMSTLNEAFQKSNVADAVTNMLCLLPSESEIDKLKNLKEFLTKCNSHISDLTNAVSKNSTALQPDNSGMVVLKIDQASFVDPRGRYDVSIRESSMFLEGKSGSHLVEWSNVQTSILLPSPSSSKKEGESLLFLVLKEPIMIKGKKLGIVSWTLSNGGPDMKAAVGPVHFSGKEAVVVDGLVEALRVCPHERPDKLLFQSSTGSSFLRCYKGVQEGTLFPLQAGILFFRPAVFLPSHEVSSIEAGRGGSAVTRYIDLKIESESGKTYEYSNIDRDELPSIQMYVQHYVNMRAKEERRKAKAQRAERAGDTCSAPPDDGDDSDDDSDSDDEDFDPDEHDQDEEAGGAEGSSDSGSDSEHADDDSEEDGITAGAGGKKRPEAAGQWRVEQPKVKKSKH